MLNIFGLIGNDGTICIIDGKAVLPILITAIILILIVGAKKHTRISQVIGYIIFTLYLSMVIELVFLPIPYHLNELGSMGELTSPVMSLIPFAELSNMVTRVAIINYIGNILLMIPMGYFISLYSTKSPLVLRTTMKVALISVCIEFIQYYISFVILDLSWRVVDIDDFLMNTTGGLVGAITFFVISKIKRKPVYSELVSE